MDKFTCERCAKSFSQKGHYTRHMNRKTPCEDVVSKIKEQTKNELITEIKSKKIIKRKQNKNINDDNTLLGNKKYIDLFCGIGGFHTALKELGCECVMASDIDKGCQDVYEMNYGMRPIGDIKKVNPEDLENFDIICGGFPCQAFSNAGNKKTFEDDRGLLFDEIMRIVKVKNPKFLFLENVKHILKVGGGEVIKYILDKLDKYNYKVQIFNMSPHDYGVPQQRERVYFVCVRKDIYKGDIKLKYPKTEEIVFENYLDKKEDIDPKYFIDGDILKCLEAWEEMIKVFDIDEKISPTIMANEFYKNYTQEELNELPTWKRDYITKNKPLYEKYKDTWDTWYEKNKDILSKREVYGKLEWQVGKIKPNDSIFNYFIQVRQSGIRVKKARYFPTLVAISQIPIYAKERRYITPKECLRLQSFPDDFKLLDDKKSYKQLGNSVNVNNVKNVIESTLSAYNYI